MAALSDLPKVLEESGYERDFLRQVGAITGTGRGVDADAVEQLTMVAGAAGTLGRLFYMGRPVVRAEIEAFLSAPLCQVLIDEKMLVDCGGGEWRAAYAIVPARGFWALRDFDGWATGKALAADHVLGVGMASAMLADLTVRRSAKRVLDLGTGQGFQAAMAAKHATSVVGTDINVRALHLAELAMRINDIRGVELRAGSFFEPVETEKGTFDLLVSNPPFVIAPPHDLTAMGGRWIGDSFVEKLITRGPEFLREGGWATVLCNWHHATAEDWLRRPASWVAGRGVDLWIVKLKTDDPRTYAENWLRESASTEGEAAMTAAQGHLPEWLEYYKTLNVGAISMGVVFMRKRSPKVGEAANWMRGDAFDVQQLAGTAGAQAQRLFEGETMLRGLRDERQILDQKLMVSAATQLTQHLKPAGGEWQSTEATIRQTEGFPFRIALGPVPAAIMARLDGNRTARDVIKELASGKGGDPEVAYAQSAPFLAKMVRMTHVGWNGGE